MLSSGIIKTLVEAESNHLRFEEFCNRLVSSFLGRPVLGTARAGDLGVDGRSLQLDVLSEESLVAASIRKDVVKKMMEDAARIRDTQSEGVVYFCSSQAMIESKKASTKRSLRGVLGNKFAVNVLTLDEIVDLASRRTEICEELYSVELASIRSEIESLQGEPKGVLQLQIAHALTSEEGDDSRDAIADRLTADLLAKRQSTPNEIAIALQATLRLSSAFPRAVIDASLARLARSQYVSLMSDGRYSLNEKGRQWRQEGIAISESEADTRRNRLSAAIEQRLGHPMSDAQLETLWRNLSHHMSDLIVRLGARFVSVIETARTNGDLNAVRNLASESVRLACRNSVRHLSNEKLRDEAEEALFQALLDSNEVALDWLETLIAAWLTACQLGLVPEISDQLRPAVKKLVLSLDTDVLLSLLCEAEPDNGPITSLLEHWTAIGGRTMVTEEVLKEVAHHAWIARAEYSEIASVIQRLPFDPGLGKQIARNAFVRSYWASKRRPSPTDFQRFLESYSGSTPDDIRSVEHTLAHFNIGKRVASPTTSELTPFGTLESRVRYVLARTAHFSQHDGSGGAIEQDKMNRDARAVARCAALANASSSTIRAVLIVTSSKRLRVAVRRGAPNANVLVAPIGTLAMLLSVSTQSALSAKSIAALMLREDAGEAVSQMRSELIRILARADLATTLPRARIVSLEREVENSIVKLARTSARPVAAVRKDVLAASNKDVIMSVVAEALRKVAIGAEVDQLLRDQKREIRRLSD